MKKFLFWMAALAALSGDALIAQDLTGTWQGALQAGGQRTADGHQDLHG